MDAFDSIIESGDKKSVDKLYSNMKKMLQVKYNKTDYNKNLTNIMILFDKINQPTEPILFSNLHPQFTLKDYKDIFGNFRRTLRYGTTKKSNVENLMKLGKKVKALRRYYAEFE